MKTSAIVWIVVIVIVVLGGWYWWSTQNSSTLLTQQTQTSTQTNTQTTVTPVLVLGTNATLGNFLVAQNGMTLYHYTKDTSGVSNCSGTCATIWPPYTVPSGAPLAVMAGITGQVSTLVRADGTTQLTYNGMPLYFYHSDTKPGDTMGQNVGGVWFVVQP